MPRSNLQSSVSACSGLRAWIFLFLVLGSARGLAQAEQRIDFPALRPRTVGDTSFTAGATATSGLPISYSSSNPRVATIDSATGRIEVLRPGVTVITAMQNGDAEHAAAAPVRRPLWVWAFSDRAVGWGYGPSGELSRLLIYKNLVAIVAGSSHILVLWPDGRVLADGSNVDGQSSIPPSLTGVVAIAAGGSHSVALKGDGTVVAWGNDIKGQTSVPPALNGVVAVAAGGAHTVALRDDGTVVAWGDSTYGQTRIPPDLNGVVAIDAGDKHTLALKNDGTVLVWGQDSWGKVSIPVGLNGVVAIAAGDNHSLALKEDGTIVAWGQNDEGQISVPQGLGGVVAIAGGWKHSLAIKSDGIVVGWGSNHQRQTAIPTNLSRAVAIDAGISHSLALVCDPPVIQKLSPSRGADTGGTVVTITGTSLRGDVSVRFGGIPATIVGADSTGNRLHVIAPPGALGTVDVSISTFAGSSTTSTATRFIYKKAQSILLPPLGHRTLGDADFTLGASTTSGLPVIYASSNPMVATIDSVTGQIHILRVGSAVISTTQVGDATYLPAEPVRRTLWVWNRPSNVVAWGENPYGPVTIASCLREVVSVARGSRHTVVLKSDGTVGAWGPDEEGQATVPHGLSGVVAITAGGAHSVALKDDGTVVAWGSNSRGQTSVPPGLTGVAAIAAGARHTVALKNDGTVVTWGSGDSGQAAIPPGLSDVAAIVSGGDHIVALKTNGTVRTWGAGGAGQTTAPAGLTGVVAIAAGEGHSLALKNDGQVVAWGRNDSRQAMVPTTAQYGVVAIAAGTDHSVALKGSGAVVGWGEDSFRQAEAVPGLAGVRALAAGGRSTVALAPAPTPTGFSPAVGPVTGGTPVVITGTGFQGDVTVRFGGILATGVVVDSSGTRIRALTPAGILGEAEITVSTPAGIGGAGRFTYRKFQSIVFPDLGRRTAGEADFFTGARSSSGLPVSFTSTNPWVATVDSATGRIHLARAGATVIIVRQAGDSEFAPTYVRQALWVWNPPGRVVGWGSNSLGQGKISQDQDQLVAIAGGGLHSLALKSDGTVFAWGCNYQGEATVPPGLSGVVAISAGNSHSVALKSDGTVVAWGDGENGKTSVPPGLSDVVAIAAKGEHTLALRNDGTVVAWGDGQAWQLKVPTGLSGVVGVAAGIGHSLALRGDGTVVAWGSDLHGETKVPPDLADVVSISGGLDRSLALTRDGAVVSWGEFGDDVPIPTDLHGIVAISAGDAHFAALHEDGSVVTWGDSSAGHMRIPPEVNGAVSISAGAFHTLALIPNPVVTRLAPSVGAVGGGTVVTLTGTGFSRASGVRFGSAPALSMVVDSSGTRITAVAPPGAVGSVDVAVITPTGSSAPGATSRFTYGKLAQAIAFDVSDQIYGNPVQVAASATSGLAVSFASSTPEACTIAVSGELHLLKIGACAITAGQNGNETYAPAPPVVRTLSIFPRKLSVVADSASKSSFLADPPLTYRVAGLLPGDSLTGALAREPGEQPGRYAIYPGTLSAGPNYTIAFTGADLIIRSLPVAISPSPRRGKVPTAFAASIGQEMNTAASGASPGALGTGGHGCDAESCQFLDLALPGPAQVRVAIYDRVGTPVIAWNESFDKRMLRRNVGRVRLWWNLRARDGVAVAPGIYLWKIEARTEDGQELEEVVRTGVR